MATSDRCRTRRDARHWPNSATSVQVADDLLSGSGMKAWLQDGAVTGRGRTGSGTWRTIPAIGEPAGRSPGAKSSAPSMSAMKSCSATSGSRKYRSRTISRKIMRSSTWQKDSWGRSCRPMASVRKGCTDPARAPSPFSRR